MHGLDFVRKLMGRAKESPIVGHRQQIANLCQGGKKKVMVDLEINKADNTEIEDDRDDICEMNIIMEALENNAEFGDDE
eukprot:10919152-Ditylum_brightwellii.AAC.1